MYSIFYPVSFVSLYSYLKNYVVYIYGVSMLEGSIIVINKKKRENGAGALIMIISF